MTAVRDEIKTGKKEPGYFEHALSDFMHDAASGGAIRHLVDLGYTTDQIMGRLDFPTPRARVEKTVCQHMLETGLLLEELPQETFREIRLEALTETVLCRELRKRIVANGETGSYVAWKIGTIRRDREARLEKMFACLTSREKEYLLGIPWEAKVMYHRLNSRMLEISVQMAIHSGERMEFYFLKSKEVIIYE